MSATAIADGPGAVVWFTGLPGSGKTTLAARLRDRLALRGSPAIVLDGDALRPILGAAGHDDAAREAFYGRLAALAAHLARQGAIVLVPATAHRRRWREAARLLAPRLIEVHVATSLADCEARDRKGLYAKARAGDISLLPGIGVPYEPPEAPDAVATGGEDASVIDRVLTLLG